MPSLHDNPSDVQSGPFDDAPDAWWDEVSPFACEPEPEVDGVALTLVDWLMTEASYYRSRDTAAARFLAAQIDALADEARALDALTVDQFEGRAHARQAERDEAMKDRGYRAAMTDVQHNRRHPLFY